MLEQQRGTTGMKLLEPTESIWLSLELIWLVARSLLLILVWGNRFCQIVHSYLLLP